MTNPPANYIAPAADERGDLDGPTPPGRPSLLALYAMWQERDEAYAQGPGLTVDQIAAIRLYRATEVSDLDPADRARAWASAKTWHI